MILITKEKQMDDPGIHFKTIRQVAELLRSKEISSLELTREILDRIDGLDGRLKSYALVMADHAIAAAKRADEEIASGDYRGPLHGVPIAIKDLCFTRGVATRGGSQALADHVPAYDATVVEKLEGAGAVLLGKLNLTEGAMGGYNPKFEVPLNPWDQGRWPGASSSGSGVATAAGLCYGSLGSDTGGSIRFPAAACGTVGLKPTWGRVSRYGVLALAESLDHVGPLTRSSVDAAIMLQAISGSDPRDPTTLPAPVPDFLEQMADGVKGIRVGLDERFITRDVDPEVGEGVLQVIKVLEQQGAEIIEVRLPDLDPYVPAWGDLCSAEAVAAHSATYPSRREDYGPWFLGWLDMGAKVTGAEYARANNSRAACRGHLLNVLSQIDVLVSPSMADPPHPVTSESQYGPLGEERQPRFQRFTAPFDFSGTPTLSVPCGMNSEGLPLSVQVAGSHLSEPLLCRVGHTYEQATEWKELHPNV